MSEIHFRCHACGRVNVIDESLLDDAPLQAECGWCGRYHDEAAIRLTPVAPNRAGAQAGEDSCLAEERRVY